MPNGAIARRWRRRRARGKTAALPASWESPPALSSSVVSVLAVDDLAFDHVFTHPRAQVGAHVFVGRQGIFAPAGTVHGYEFLYRSGRQHALRVDLWPAEAQDRATLRVLQATFSPTGVRALAAEALVFVNFTRAFLVGDLPLPDEPERLVVEIVESVRADDAVIAGVARLRARGFRLAIDDFVGLTSQVALLPYADYVKIDLRDLAERGEALVALARTYGATLVAERIETVEQLAWCRELGFHLFQGFRLEETQVLNRTPVPTQHTERPILRALDGARPRPPALEPAAAS